MDVKNVENIDNLLHQKRVGTSGVGGQLYETKLLSLINFRLEHDDDIDEFYVGTNVDGLGNFDDVCIKLRTKHMDKPAAVFIQAKHRNVKNKELRLTPIDLFKYFSSYLEIRQKFRVESTDAFFNGSYEDVESIFVFYTNTNDQLKRPINEDLNCLNGHMNKVNKIITTGDYGFKYCFTDVQLKILKQNIIENKIENLAIVLAKIVLGQSDKFEMCMTDENIQTYHVILARKVFNITKPLKKGNGTEPKYQIASFKSEFFTSSDENVQYLQDCLHSEIIKDKSFKDGQMQSQLSQLTFSGDTNPCNSSTVALRNDKLKFIDATTNKVPSLSEQLRRQNVADTDYAETSNRTAMKILRKAELKLPLAFGNSDLNIRGSDAKVKKRLSHLAVKIVELLNGSKERKTHDTTYNVVCIDDEFPDKGLLRINGGIGSAVGNLLILDEITNLLKFDHGENLSGKAKILFAAINKQVCDMDKYRFDVRITNFPKLTMGLCDHQRYLVEDFTNKFIIYTNQANHSEVANILKKEIGFQQKNLEQSQLDTIFLTYHDAIQKWWMEQKNTEYLTKSSQLFGKAIKVLKSNSILRCIDYVCRKNWHIDSGIEFKSDVVEFMKFDETKSEVKLIVSDVITLSSIKFSQCFKDCIIADLDYISSLPQHDCGQLNDELGSVKYSTIILTCINFPRGSKLYKIYNILQTLNEMNLIIVTNEESVHEIQEYYPNSVIIRDDKISLTDLSNESQEKILMNARVVFQDVEVDLNMLMDDFTKGLIKGEYLNKIISGENITLGDPLTDSRYEKIKRFYVSRKVKIPFRGKFKSLETFNDINERAVLITGPPGMGKSSLLTNLSLQTKERDPGVWIIRINLLDYSRFFFQWKEHTVDVDILEALRFICIVLVDRKINTIMSDINIVLKEENGDLFVEDTEGVSDAVVFEVMFFLNFCSRRRVIFIFDGFDEICPHYEIEVIQLLKVLKSYRCSEHRIWVTSRNYNQILHNIELNFSRSTELLPLSSEKGREFVEKFLQSHINLHELNNEQRSNIDSFVTNMEQYIANIKQGYDSITTIYLMYLLVLEYFINRIEHASYLPIKDMCKSKSKYIRDKINNTFTSENLAIPLHLYMVLDYVQNGINDSTTKWDVIFNTYAFYERLVETKIRKIRFEDKNKMDLTNPDIELIFQEKRNECLAKHKKLAVFTLFNSKANKIFGQNEIKEIETTIELLKSGIEKTGLIEGVVDNRPRFVHKTFAEYLAVEYVCDLFKTDLADGFLSMLWYLLLNSSGELHLLDAKLGLDVGLYELICNERHGRAISGALLSLPTRIITYSYICNEPMPRIRSLCATAFMSVNNNNIHSFVRFANDTALKLHALGCDSYELVDAVINIARNVNEVKFLDSMNSVLKLRAVDAKDIDNIAAAVRVDQILSLKCIDVVYKIIHATE